MARVFTLCALCLGIGFESLFGQQPVEATPAASAVTSLGQHAVDPTQTFHRLICLVHLTGSGKVSDPMRPEYVPAPAAAVLRSGNIAWSFQATDDGKMAIVHLVAVDRNAFQAIFADTRPEIRVFEIGKATRTQIETEMGKYKAGFNLDALKVVAR
jgi:hypothetical protein